MSKFKILNQKKITFESLMKETVKKRLRYLDIDLNEIDDLFEIKDSYNYYNNEKRLVGLIVVYDKGFRYIKQGKLSKRFTKRLTEGYFDLFNLFDTPVFDKVEKIMPKNKFSVQKSIAWIVKHAEKPQDLFELLEYVPDTIFSHQIIDKELEAMKDDYLATCAEE